MEYSVMSTKQQSEIVSRIDSIKSKIESLLDGHIKNVKSLNDDKEQWEKEKSAIASSHTFDARIKLDVGGAHFTTTSATLTRFPDTMLGAMFSGRHKLVVDESGHYFIDRDGTHFRHILNYLRCPEDFDVTVIDAVHVKELKKEACYYGLGDLMFPAPFPALIENIETKDNKGNKTVCKKVDGLWHYSYGGRNMGALYYCRVCKSGCHNLFTQYPTQCAKCAGY